MIEKNRIFASISGLNIDDIYRCFNELSPLVVGIELNISSPNTQGLKNFHNLKNLQKLLKILNNKKTKPLIVKLPPCAENQNSLLEMVKCVHYSGSDGVVNSNSHPIKNSNLKKFKNYRLIFFLNKPFISKVKFKNVDVNQYY